jgi:hypothetical protein
MPSLVAAGLSAGFGADSRPGIPGARLRTAQRRNAQLSSIANALEL